MPARSPGPDLATLLRDRRDDILAAWKAAAERIPRARKLAEQELADHLPSLLDRIGALVDEDRSGGAEALGATARRHALDRLDHGFELTDIVAELTMLRSCILRVWAHELGRPPEPEEHRALGEAIDFAVTASLESFARARDRILRALDRVSTVALASTTLDELLDELLAVVLDEVPAVDTVAVLLREGDRLVVRATHGLERDGVEGRYTPEDFAEHVAASREPLEVKVGAPPHPGVRTLYGVPLIAHGGVVGVAYMGSQSLGTFSPQDLLLFRSMADRAASGIYQQILRDSAERRARALEETERRFEATFDHAAVGIAHLAPDGSWLRLNPRYCQMLGYPHDELLSLRFQDLTHPDDLAEDQALAERLRSGEIDHYVLEKRYIRKDRGALWVELSASAVRDEHGDLSYFVATARDLTERKRAEQALAEREERLRLVIDATDIGAFDYDPQTGHLDWSAHAKRHFGLPPDAEVDFDTFLRGLHPEDRDRVRQAVQSALRPQGDGGYAVEYRTIGLDDGQERWISARGRVTHDPHGRPIRFLGITVDVSASKRAEQREQEAARRKDEFLATLGHELRNPLAAIRSASELLRVQTGEDERLRAIAAVLDRQSRQMTRLVDGLLEISRIASGKVLLEPEAVELGALVGAVVDDRQPQAARHGVHLDRNGPDEPVWVWGDPVRLTQVVDNLVGNALKFTERGGRIDVFVERADDAARVTVRDTGIGIRPELLEQLFDPFLQDSRTAGRTAGGLGLGLAVARGLVQLHGGEIRAHSAGPGAGAAFVVHLPLGSPPETRSHIEPEEAPGPPRRVLIVDDNADAAAMLGGLLERRGHRVRIVGSGAAALDALRRGAIDVVLCDLGLPEMDGYAVARAVRSDPRTRSVRMIALSGYGTSEDRQRALQAGFDAHLVKPTDLGVLQRALTARADAAAGGDPGTA